MLNTAIPKFSSNIVFTSPDIFRGVAQQFRLTPANPRLDNVSLKDQKEDVNSQFKPVDKATALASPCVIGGYSSSDKIYPFHIVPVEENLQQTYKQYEKVLDHQASKIDSGVLIGARRTKLVEMFKKNNSIPVAQKLVQLAKGKNITSSYFLESPYTLQFLYLNNDKKYGIWADSYVISTAVKKSDELTALINNPVGSNFINWIKQFTYWFVANNDDVFVVKQEDKNLKRVKVGKKIYQQEMMSHQL